jgi:hypothetical protein
MLSHRGFFDLAQAREDPDVESAVSESAGCDDRER